jgi:hypothetical protein
MLVRSSEQPSRSSRRMPGLLTMSRREVLVFATICACGAPASTGGTTAAPPGYESDDEPGEPETRGADCTADTCESPEVCVHLTTDTTLDVPERSWRSVCASPDGDLCKIDPGACRAPPQRASCSIADLKPTSDEERTVLLNIARRCKPIDQCLLECIRSGCAGGIGGGCFHACGIRGVPPDERDAVLLREAAAYRARTHYFCRSREHESR